MKPLKFNKVVPAMLATITFLMSSQVAFAAPTVSVSGVAQGPNTFISFVDLTGFAGNTFKGINFKISPKANATAAAMQGTYTAAYLKNRGYLNSVTGAVRVPVYGLYQSYNNQVTLTYTATFGRKSINVPIQTSAWDNGCNGSYSTRTDIVARNRAIKLNYSYFMLKGWVCNAHPVVMDVDGQVRWAGTAGDGQQGSTFFGNSMYLGSGSQLYKMELDGTYAQVGDYSAQGYSTFHHNIDFGKTGLLLDFNRNSDLESDIVEVSKNGALLKEWDLAAIIEQAMIAGGDNPNGFVYHDGYDWFHNNAATYWPQRNELVVSSRENFVIGIGYDDKKIKWILGDPEKAWHQYASLRAFALTMPVGTHPPIGNHAVSITSAGNLMLFDNGYQSFAHNPSGSSRSYSAPRQYSINSRTKTATEIWNFEHGQTVWSPICSSIYQDGSSYLIDYASEDGGIRLVGLDSRSNIAFEWKLPGTAFYFGWNALPIHIENLSY